MPVLEAATDICLWLTVIVVTLCFGGRAAVGQLALVIGASLTAFFWLLNQLMSAERKYVWTGSEWLWLAGILVGVVQIVSLSQIMLLTIAPQMGNILPLWLGRDSSKLVPSEWHQLSLAPWDTASGLATFVAYAILFAVAAQRIKAISDVEAVLRCVAITTAAMATFALLQYFVSNGKFYWFIQHPFMSTEYSPHGSFTNHNHLGQYLALGCGPMIWWILRPAESRDTSDPDRFSRPILRFGSLAKFLGLALPVLAVLLTASRGGLLAIGLAILVSLTLLSRIGLASARLVAGLCLAGIVTGAVFYFTGYESLASRVDKTADVGAESSGRVEIWQANIQVASDFPWFGTGVGTHEDAHQLRLDFPNSDGKVFTHAENGYLQVASETGMAGLVVLFLMISSSVWWCLRGFWNRDVSASAAAAAISASLIANVCHAIFDFFWYTPACMLLLAVQLACACRLAAFTREASGRIIWSLALPRPVVVMAGCGLAAITYWMAERKLSPTLAEPYYMRYLALTFDEKSADEEERLEQDQERQQAILRAARRDPHNSRIQEAAAFACLEMFDTRQQKEAENPLSLAQIRDAVMSSGFESEQSLKEWVEHSVGRNLKLLHMSKRYLLRSLQASPLRATAYVSLLELGFLESSDSTKDMPYLDQALKLRPNDADILFAVGKNVLLAGDQDGALKHWRAAFQRSRQVQQQIISILAANVTPEFFVESFNPEWQALRLLADAYLIANRPDDAYDVWRRVIADGTARLKNTLPANERESMSLALRDAYFAINDPDRGIRVLQNANKLLPLSASIHARLGWDLYLSGRYAEAAEHLQWCAARNHNDKGLQFAASISIKERLKTVSSGANAERF